MTEIHVIDPQVGHSEVVAKAARILTEGGLVAFPTETVYGLGVRADLPEAVSRLRTVKGRSADKALTVHLGNPEEAARFVPQLSGLAKRFIRKGWPGPLTLVIPVEDPSQAEIMKGRNGATSSVLYYDGTIGLRCPDDPIAAALLRSVQAPVVATSANAAGNAAPQSGQDVLRELDDQLDLLIDAGRTRYARPSTVVKVTEAGHAILREGVLDARIIEKMAVLRLLFVCTGNTCRSPMAAGLTRKILADRVGCAPGDLPARGIMVESAGTAGGWGGAAEHAVAVMARHGVDISDHLSAPLLAETVLAADHVFVMTRAHRAAVLDVCSSAANRVRLLAGDEDIADPIGGSVEDYESCARIIEGGLEQRLNEVEL
jgi:protein-tyrosine phosphatase